MLWAFQFILDHTELTVSAFSLMLLMQKQK